MESLQGAIDEIVYYNPENGYTVCRFVVEGQAPVTLVGCFPPLSPGETLAVEGAWESNPRFGRQFRAETCRMVLPASAAGLRKFLASGLIKGIGPVLAGRIVDRFGAATAAVLEEHPERLAEVEGVGPAKLKEIGSSWSRHRDIRDLIIFLQEHGVSTGLATKIHRQYEGAAFHILKTRPYQLCLDIWGIGFKTADQIALKLGLDPRAPERVEAYILYILEKDNEQGHVFTLSSRAAAACLEDLDAGPDAFAAALGRLSSERRIVAEDLAGDKALYRPFLHHAEREAAGRLHALARFPAGKADFPAEDAIAGAERDLGLTLSSMQRTAVAESLARKILVITGGPGTGKTTIIRAIVDVFERGGRRVVLAAPTGRAAKRLSDSTGRDARTLHRVLEFRPKDGRFGRDEGRPLMGDVLIIDEFSMVDLPLCHHLLKAVPARMRLILVGDKDQLPSVGPGSLLRDVIDSGTVAVVRLDEIFRQERRSLIVLNAHRVNRGEPLVYPGRDDRDADFFFIRQEDEEKVVAAVLDLCADRIPRKLGLPALSTRIQVISPMYGGPAGVDNLNRELQRRLNPSGAGVRLGGREFRVRDKVMQVRNDYDKDAFNGDVGTILQLDRARSRVIVDFEGRPVVYERDDLNDLAPAYAVSVHKSQGSEYDAVVMPLLTRHFILLQRNLFYTALTRAKRLSVIVGSPRALHIAIRNDRPVRRNGRLKDRLEALARSGDGLFPV